MVTNKDIIDYVIRTNNLHTTTLVRVPPEQIYNTASVKHICQSGITYLHKNEIQIPVTNNNGGIVVLITLWNCPYCGKTYYNIIK